MCALAVEDMENLMVDSWEALCCDEAGELVYRKTADVLKHVDYKISAVLGGIQTLDGAYKRAQIILLIGADVAMTMADPNVWATSDLDEILGSYGGFIVERPAQVALDKAPESLRKYDKIWVASPCYNDVTSTKIREEIRNGNVAVDLPDNVIDYIRSNHLYQEERQMQLSQKDLKGVEN